jgi:hypothetical protein
MTKSVKDVCSFATMALLIFVATNIPSLMGGVTTGPNRYVEVGIGGFGWLRLHQDGSRWSVEDVDFRMLLAELLIAATLTWLLSKMLSRRRHDH